MKNTILVGRDKSILEIPADDWRKGLEGIHEYMPKRLAFMTPEHHRVRYAAVRELPRNGGQPLTVSDLVDKTGLERPRLETILKDLERNLFFLVRNDAGDVTWAFTVTTERTPHRLTFSTGERLFGA